MTRITWPGRHAPGRLQRESATRHTGKISIALINIPVGKNCLVRRRAQASNFFHPSRNFFREKFARRTVPARREAAKSSAKHRGCVQRKEHGARCNACSRKQRVKSFFTLPLQCIGQSVVWSRVADSVA
jgi:hypothetical protein